MATNTNSNAATGVYGAGTFMSAYDTIALKPQAYAELLQKFGEGLNIFNFLNMAQSVIPVTTPSLRIIEEGSVERLVTVSANTALAGAEASLTFNTADDSDHYVREGFDIIIPGSKNSTGYDKPMRIYKSGSDWKGRFWDTTTALDVALSTTEVAVGPSAFGPGTGQPASMKTGLFSRSTSSRLFKETNGIEGGQLYKEDFYAVETANGAKGLLSKGLIQMDFRLDSQIDAALLLSELNANTSNITSTSEMTGETTAISSFDGLLPTMRKLGLPLNWTSTFDATQFTAVKALLESVGVTNRNIDFMVGSGLNAAIETGMQSWLNTNSHGTDLYDMVGKISFQVRELTLNSCTFKIMELHSFSNPVKFGGSNYNFKNIGMMFPQGQRKVSLSAPGGAKETLNLGHLTLGYPSGKGEDRRRTLSKQPGVSNQNAIAASDVDGDWYYMFAEVMPIWAYMNQTILSQKLATH